MNIQLTCGKTIRNRSSMQTKEITTKIIKENSLKRHEKDWSGYKKYKSQSETNLKGHHGVTTRASSKVRNLQEERLAQVHAKKIEKQRPDDRGFQKTIQMTKHKGTRVKISGETQTYQWRKQESKVDWATPSAFPSRMAKKGPRTKSPQPTSIT